MQRAAAIILWTVVAALAVTPGASPAATRPALLHGSATPTDLPSERWYVTIPGGDEDRLIAIFHDLQDQGASRMQCFLPDVIVCDVPVTIDASSVARGPGVVSVRADDTALLSGYSLSIQPAALERARVEREAERRRQRDTTTFSARAVDTGSLESLSRTLTLDEMRANARMAAASPDSDFRLIFQNCEILAGMILMQLVLPDSDYPETNLYYQSWSSDAMANIDLALYYMGTDLQDEFPNAGINLVYKWYRRVPIKAEPVYLPTSKDKFWIALTMAQLGYPGDESTVLTNVHQFNEAARLRTGSDWVFTAFIANAERKTDHRFVDARNIAWEYVGGPYCVTSYPAGHLGGSFDFMTVLKHELSHMFWGVEEDIGPATTCETRSGYLDIINANKVTEYSPIDATAKGCPDGQNPVDCIMNEMYAYAYYTTVECNITQAMFGVSDDNENSVPDALDRAPAIVFDAADIETVLTSPDFMHVHVVAQSVPNMNPRQPAELRRDYAARIRDITVRVGGVPPYTLKPNEIGSDGYEADFEVGLPPLLPGPLEILVDARNEFNATSDTRVKRYVHVDLKYVTFGIHHPNEGVRVNWYMLGETFSAVFELVRANVDTGEEVVVASGFGPNGPITNGLTPYSVLDPTTVIGERYTYQVRGTIDLPHSTGVLHKVVESVAIPTQGAVPRTHAPASPVSNAAPNPFTDKTWISVTVPFVDTPAPGIAQSSSQTADEPSTFVRIDIYDVLGRRVAVLFDRWVIGSAVTVSWDGRDAAGTALPSGMYFVRTHVGTLEEVRKIMLIR